MEKPTIDSYDLKMYKQKKATHEITPGDPQFYVRYVGKVQVFVASGSGCTQRPVQQIWDNFYDERGMEKVSVLINSSGIVLNFLERSRELVVDIKDIAYCCAERGAHKKIFAWISKDPKSKKLECHALLCSSPDKAQSMATSLYRAFHVAYKDWKHVKGKKIRHQVSNGQPSLGFTPGRSADDRGTDVTRGRVTSGGSRCNASGLESESISSESDGSNDGINPLMETLMAQMNIVEEEEISLTDNGLILEH